MKLWVETDAVNTAGRMVQAKVSEMTAKINRQVLSRATRAVDELRNAETRILNGTRTGRVYKVPGTGVKRDENGKRVKTRISKQTRGLLGDYGHRLRYGGVLYRASAAGEPPARRTGILRLHWYGDVEAHPRSNGIEVVAFIESGEKYASMLENGTPKMVPRPFVERIKAEALPKILQIYEASYR